MVDQSLLAELKSVDWSTPSGTRDGRPVYAMRCRIPFQAPVAQAPRRVERIERNAAAVPLMERVIVEDPDQPEDGIGSGQLPPGATGDMGEDVPQGILVAGIASSTSVDFYGTEMSLKALVAMARQMSTGSGIPYLPRHNYGMQGGVEWDEVIGRTVAAEVVPASAVKSAFEPGEPQYVLNVTTRLYEDEPHAASLVRRIQRGEPIGQSIGGWFTDLEVMQNEDGDVERIVVQGVELDHLAVTRAPANPDSASIASLRSRLTDAIRAQRAAVSVEVEVDGEDEGETDAEDVSDDGESCPVSTGDIAVNLANRQRAIDVAHYGPANPDDPGTYWADKAARMRADEEQVRKMVCGNCAFFNIKQAMLDCIAKGIGADAAEVIDAGQLGFCEAFDFKCAARRTCDAWVVGGPIADPLPVEPASEPAAPEGESRAVGDVDPTNFPKAGEDRVVSLRNSEYAVFDPEYAAELKDKFPDVWGMGGNIKGNEQYADLSPVVARGGAVENDTEEAAVRLREAWAARHFENTEVPGVVAQIKWFVVGTLGESGMKALIDEEKTRMQESSIPTEARSVTPFADLPLAPEETEWTWDAAAQNAILGDPPDWEAYRRAHLWFDPERAEVKDGYKLAIALRIDGRLHAVWRGVAAAMSVVNGGRGGADISESDRRGVYDHLVRYYAKFGKEPPPFARSVDNTEGSQYSASIDARRSAVPSSTAPSGATTEIAMGDEKVTMTVADLRRMIGEEVARATNSHSAVSASPEIDWKARAIAAERSLSHLARGERVGRAVGSLTVQPGPVARTQFGGLVERARGDAPTLATVAEACLTESLDERSDKATKAQLIENLAAVINAAEADGLITNPIARSAAGWR